MRRLGSPLPASCSSCLQKSHSTRQRGTPLRTAFRGATGSCYLQTGAKEHQLRLADFDVLTFDMIGTLIYFETGVLQFARPRILRFAPTATDTEILECYARAQSTVR